MRKAKVSRIIDEQKREAFAAGKRAGINEEKERTSRLFPIRNDGLVYLDPPPKDPTIRNYPLDAGYRMLEFGGFMLEFEAIQKNIVWFDWKPMR